MHNKLKFVYIYFLTSLVTFPVYKRETSQVEKYQWKNEKGGKNAPKGISLNFYFHIRG